MIKPSDWKTVPMPNETDSFYSGRSLVAEEFLKLSAGIKPASMDDKWFVYYQNESIYFHRSWLGHCIFIAQVEKEKNGVLLGNVIANKKPDQFGMQDIDAKKEMFNKLVDYLLRQ